MSGYKRDRNGQAKRYHNGPRQAPPTNPVIKNQYTPMFEHFRDELDKHHDRRERIVKASRDITALSKKIIFALQRVRKIEGELPEGISGEVNTRLDEIAKLLASIAPDTQGLNRHRYAYSLRCLEELVEAMTFAHYLKTQSLISPAALAAATDALSRRGAQLLQQQQQQRQQEENREEGGKEEEEEEPAAVALAEDDYLYGVFDLSGEMMRFATTTTALTGRLASFAGGAGGGRRTIVRDMQDLGSFFEMLPQQRGKTWAVKMDVLRASVAKVEKLGYGITVRGSEREKGWVPDMRDEEAPGMDE